MWSKVCVFHKTVDCIEQSGLMIKTKIKLRIKKRKESRSFISNGAESFYQNTWTTAVYSLWPLWVSHFPLPTTRRPDPAHAAEARSPSSKHDDIVIFKVILDVSARLSKTICLLLSTEFDSVHQFTCYMFLTLPFLCVADASSNITGQEELRVQKD